MTRLTVHTRKPLFPVAPDLYGLFFEDINRAGDGGLYPEMIRNRAFEDSVPPAEVTVDDNGYSFTSDYGWTAVFNHGEGLTKWVKQNRTPETPIPAWYAEGGAVMTLLREDTLNPNRLAALDIVFGEGCVYNIGFAGIAAEKGKSYGLTLFAKSMEGETPLAVSLERPDGTVCASAMLRVKSADYEKYSTNLLAKQDGFDCRLVFRGRGRVRFGFTSLMPLDTYENHGLRKDLAELYKGIHPRFLRFPGGCVVEGFTRETMNRFHKSLGPVWERPGHYQLWHYRTTNGLGFHEFLRLCEDLGAEPLYVCNCGIICQGRSHENNVLEGQELRDMLRDTLDALEYANGDISTPYGRLRAEAGHPEPFRVKYLEIGNENHGPAYNERYTLFRDAVREKYPDMIFVANTHVERDGLPTDIVDEHFYSDVHFFTEHLNHYDGYDRKGPGVFVGEVAVNVADTGNLRAALSEAFFFVGCERNQDIVRLASYAPMMENIHFAAWAPNLIAFDNHRSYGIPSYYIWKLFGTHRGDTVVTLEEETARVFRPAHGMPAIMGSVGSRFRNPLWQGKPVVPGYNVLGFAKAEDDGWVILPPDETQADLRYLKFVAAPDGCHINLGEDESALSGTFEVEILPAPGKPVALGIFSSHAVRSWYDLGEEMIKRPWDARFDKPYKWVLENGQSRLIDTAYYPHKDLCEPVPCEIKEGEYLRVGYECDSESIRVFLDGKLIQSAPLPSRQRTASVVTTTDTRIILKTVNFSESPENIRIRLDCPVESAYTLARLTGDPTAVNTIDDPTHISDEVLTCSGASEDFVFTAAPWSANILILTKKGE